MYNSIRCTIKTWKCIVILVTSILFLCIELCAFPDSANPIMVTPPLDIVPEEGMDSCTFNILTGDCSSYYEVTMGDLIIPSKCANEKNWERVVLDFSASQKGIQFDRTGGIWIGDIEVLRTTTPEPDSPGIFWSIKKDITEYRQYIQANMDKGLKTFVSIPNNIDSTYTGVPVFTLSMTIFISPETGSNVPSAPLVIPLTNASRNSFPWNEMTLVGTNNFTYDVTLPNNGTELWLEILADPHGCEEFYYTNSDTDSSSTCGGGVYREIQVYVDDIFAGTTYHFPVVYTGGINFFCWEPVVGIMAFDIPPKRFDLTPFLHFFNDGKKHTISMKVLGNNVNGGGYWFLDALLLVYDYNTLPDFQKFDDTTIIDSQIAFKNSDAQITDDRNSNGVGGGFTTHTQGYHTYEITRTVTFKDGTVATRSVRGVLGMFNDNEVENAGTTGISNERTIALTISSGVIIGYSRSSLLILDNFPQYVYSYFKVAPYTLNGTLDYTYNRIKIWNTNSGEDENNELFYLVNIRNHLYSDACYSSAVESDISLQHFGIETSDSDVCFSRLTSAKDGYIDHDLTVKNSCKFPGGMRLCSYDTCGSFATMPVSSWTPNEDYRESMNEITKFIELMSLQHKKNDILTIENIKMKSILFDISKVFNDRKADFGYLKFKKLLKDVDLLKMPININHEGSVDINRSRNPRMPYKSYTRY